MTDPAPAGVLCVGNIVFDVLVRPVDRLDWGTTTWVEAIEQHLGGNGANTSCALATLGVPARLLGTIGNDTPGDQLLAVLRAAGVDTAHMSRSDAPTPTTVALVNSAGERLFLHRPGSSSEAFCAPVDLTPTLLDGVSHLHLANVFALPSFRPHAAETLRRAKVAGLSTSLDTGWDSQGLWLQELGPCLAHVDVLFVNQDEARMLTGHTSPSEAAEALARLGTRDVVVKLGAAGCAVFSADQEVRVPAFDVAVVDTTGAGDCFAGGYLAALQRGCSHDVAAKFGNAAGALAVRQLGAAKALLSWEEAEAWIRGARLRAAG